jgi:hypothetical protein
MYFLIYTSYALSSSERELKALLQQARERNKSRAITGMLIYLSGIYIQLLEGVQDDVKLLYQAIKRDTRHENVALLKQGTIESRYFNDWSMSFKAISAEDLAHEESYRCLTAPSKENVASVLRVFELLRSQELR